MGAGQRGDVPVRAAGLHRRGHPAVHRGVLAGSFRLPDGPEPLDLPRHRLRRADAGRIPAVPPGHGSPGPRRSRGDSSRRDSSGPRVCAASGWTRLRGPLPGSPPVRRAWSAAGPATAGPAGGSRASTVSAGPRPPGPDQPDASAARTSRRPTAGAGQATAATGRPLPGRTRPPPGRTCRARAAAVSSPRPCRSVCPSHCRPSFKKDLHACASKQPPSPVVGV